MREMKMFNVAKKFLGTFDANGATGAGKTANADLRVAACALLLEMSLIDGTSSPIEREKVLTILRQDYYLSDEEAESLLTESRSELDESIDLWQFTNAINQHFSIQEKSGLVEKIWEIAYADGIVDQYEDYLVHKIADLLHLSHRQLIDAKLKVARHLSK
jgi:uncharacterized tellurite resistance protein B-like protein